jgi:hypothetical protein
VRSMLVALGCARREGGRVGGRGGRSVGLNDDDGRHHVLCIFHLVQPEFSTV